MFEIIAIGIALGVGMAAASEWWKDRRRPQSIWGETLNGGSPCDLTEKKEE